jgi:hypothetical protein
MKTPVREIENQLSKNRYRNWSSKNWLWKIDCGPQPPSAAIKYIYPPANEGTAALNSYHSMQNKTPNVNR